MMVHVEYAVNDGIVVDLSTGTLQVINAKIPHFSRYGFINGTADLTINRIINKKGNRFEG